MASTQIQIQKIDIWSWLFCIIFFLFSTKSKLTGSWCVPIGDLFDIFTALQLDPQQKKHCRWKLGAVHILCQPKMGGSRPPLPPLSASVSIFPTPPPFAASVLSAYAIPPSTWMTNFFLKKIQNLTKVINMSRWGC